MSNLKDKLLIYAKNNLNVMFIGSHGVGKSTVARDVIGSLGIKCKYYSASTLDPWADLVGIPVPNKETKSADFFRPQDLNQAEAVIFDELNRAHPRVLNAVLEIVQFKTINGTPLPKLKFVWCCINPPNGEYQVEDLDPALVDRFHVFIKMPAVIDADYLKTKMNEKIVKVLSDWWNTDLDNQQRNFMTPRRIEYIGVMIDKGIPWRDAVPQGHTFPIQTLEEKLAAIQKPEKKVISFTRDHILNNVEEILDLQKKNPQISKKLFDCFMGFEMEDIFEVRDLVENLPKELCVNLAEKRFDYAKSLLKNRFIEKKIDISKYPKISKAFSFDTLE